MTEKNRLKGEVVSLCDCSEDTVHLHYGTVSFCIFA